MGRTTTMLLKLYLVVLDDLRPFCRVKGYTLLVHPTVLVVKDSRVIFAHCFKERVLMKTRLTMVEIIHLKKIKKIASAPL